MYCDLAAIVVFGPPGLADEYELALGSARFANELIQAQASSDMVVHGQFSFVQSLGFVECESLAESGGHLHAVAVDVMGALGEGVSQGYTSLVDFLA